MNLLHNRMSNGAFYPDSPIIGRFVSPWDTSGWYSVYANFSVGAKLHSNEEITAVSVPDRYVGADYIMTFNSTADAFDDKQEVDFFAEQDITVGVCLDRAVAFPTWSETFTETDDVIEGSDGRTYRIFEKFYRTGEHVHIDGLKGEGNHFVILAVPTGKETKKALPKVENSKNKTPDYEKRTYKSYLAEVFNGKEALEKFNTVDCKLEKRKEDEKDSFVRMKQGSYLSYALENPSDRIVLTAKVGLTKGVLALAVIGECGAIGGAVLDGNMLRTLDGEDICSYEMGKEAEIRLVVDTYSGSYDVWMNCRKMAENIEVLSDADIVGIGVSCDGDATLDNLYCFDDTELYVGEENFDFDASTVSGSKNAEVKLVDLPFASDRSVALTSKDDNDTAFSYSFDKVKGVCTVETKVKANGSKLVMAPIVTDGMGHVACRVAFYKNCLYATNGDRWVELYEGLTDWQYYPCGNWYHVKVTVNTETSTYTLMVDGAVRAKDFAFTDKVSKVCEAIFTAETGETLLVNRIKVYDAADFSRGVLPNAPLFDVKDYGAVGDGKTMDRGAIQKAIDDAAYTGGTVYLHDGVFYTGELLLRSDMTLFVDTTATVVGSQDHSDYPLRVPHSSLCAHRQLGRGLVYGHEISNVRVTGGGMLDGSGRYRFKMNDPYPDKREQDARPDIVYISYSNGITVENINMKSSCFWTVVPLSSSNVLIRNLNLDCMNTPNRDGIDPVDCHDMTISGCRVMAGDDGLCFKSSDPVGCYNIDVYDMTLQSLASGIKFGTDTYYALKNAKIVGCTVKNVNRCGISLETVDGAAVENVIFERIDMTDVGAPVYITVGNRNRLPRKEGIEARDGYIKNVLFQDLRFEKPYPFSYTKNIREIMAIGQNEKQMIEDVTFKDCIFYLPGGFSEVPGTPKTIDKSYPEYDRHGLSAGSAFTLRYCKNFRTENVDVRFAKEDARPLIAKFDCMD